MIAFSIWYFDVFGTFSPLTERPASDQLVSPASPTRTASNSLVLLIAGLLFLNALSISVSFYLYRWRRLIIGGSPYLAPEQWAHHLDSTRASVVDFARVVAAMSKNLDAKIDGNSDQIGNLSNTFMTLRSVIDEREAEIKRFKRGYDRDVYSRFLTRFIRLDIAINEKQDTQYLMRLSQDALDECGVEQFSPILGSDYRELGNQVADHPRTLPAALPSQDFTVAEIIEPGYALQSAENLEILIPARVAIFRSDVGA